MIGKGSGRAALQKARYVMVGGFLGAGKTTAVLALAERLAKAGRRVGLITNDQSVGLVDTALLRSRGFPVEEIAGGCFCCRFDSLQEAASKLTAETRPEVFLAEPVGSCTDLVATVSYPLRRIYGDRFTIAPLSVLLDPVRAGRIFGLLSGRSFSDKVVYVFEKQLEEADIIVINKCDLIDSELRERLTEALRQRFPRAEVFACEARAGLGLEPWFERLLSEEKGIGPTVSIDYDVYAEGEARLGWLNGTIRLGAAELFDANALLVELAESIQKELSNRDREVAHLKMTLESPEGQGQLSVVSVVGTDAAPHLRESLFDAIGSGSLVINLRAEADPAELRGITEEALSKAAERRGLRASVEHLESFCPERPTPTHRITNP